MLLVLTLIGLLILYIALRLYRHFFCTVMTYTPSSHLSPYMTCPVCGRLLVEGENLRSRLFQGKAGSSDQLCYVYGCPYCYPVARPGVTRVCPVCHKELDSDSYLVARMFNKTKSGKPHVIINGCKECNYKNKKK